MKSSVGFTLLTFAAAFGVATAAAAGTTPLPGPAPLLGAGLPGLAILAVAGAGYVTMRIRRRGRD
jgi:hypothetical protein